MARGVRNPYAPYQLGKSYTLKGIGEKGEDLRGKFFEVDHENNFKFQITSRNTELEEFWTKRPSEDVVLKGK